MASDQTTDAEIEARLRSAVEAFKAGNVTEARAACEAVLQRRPDNIQAHTNLAILDRREGRLAEAAARFEALLQRRPDDTAARRAYAGLILDMGRFDEAEAEYRRLAELTPDDPVVFSQLAVTLCYQLRPEEALPIRRRASELAPDDLGIAFAHAHNLALVGDIDGARRVVDRAKALAPDNAAVRYLEGALAARPEVVPPPAFLAGTYNSVARIYDTAVAPKLQNTANEHLFALFDREFDPASRFAHVLDLGCGTGAMGAHLRSYADRLTGVDFSTGMIRIAEQKGIYDALVVDDIVRYLAQSEDQFDLIVSSDALIHLGDMAELFQHIVLRTTQGGCVLFSTEHGDCGTYAPTIHFRFQHDPDYVERTAYAGGLIVLAREQAVVRVDERGMPTRGDLFLLQKMDF